MAAGNFFLLFVCTMAKQPHVVFVLVDDMGFNDFYTSSDIAAAWPNVKRLATNDCVHVEHYYTQPSCTPTRGAFMTGRSPFRLGLQHRVIVGAQRYGLPLDEATLPQKLQAVGYSTVGIGKWHLGLYNNASLPTRRGFDHWYGFWQGGESHSSHIFPPGLGVLDLSNDEKIDRGQHGVYSAELFGSQAVKHIIDHKKNKPTQPLFLYLAMQNVHNPLEAPARYTSAFACVNIQNADRKTFCGMALSVDEAIGNVSSAMYHSFPGEDIVLFITGDNGGFPGAAGNNCNERGSCLRGTKGMLWEGGIRNNALVCSETLLPSSGKGQVFSKGLVHVMDWHATIQELAGAGNISSKPLDGQNVWTALTKNEGSPRKEFLANIDPCAGSSRLGNSCHGVEAAYRFQGCLGSPPVCGDWKLLSGAVFNASWYHLPTSSFNNPAPGIQDASGCVSFDQAPGMGSFPPPLLPNSTRFLYNLSADPEERNDLAMQFPKVVIALQEKIDALATQAVAPCNIVGGSCSNQDLKGLATAFLANAWIPWIADMPNTIVV